MLTAARLMRTWSGDRGMPAHRRLAPLLASLDGARVDGDSLGDRNRRLLRLHRSLGRGVLEACVKCSACGVDNELAVPVAQILASPPAAHDAQARVKCGGRLLAFRLPRMRDIDTAFASGGSDVRGALLARCRVDATGGTLHPAATERLGRAFERLDPAATVVLSIACAGCGAELAATVDVATLVAHEIDAVVEGLFRDVDVLAHAYGWSEAAILALPARRRQRYVALAATPRGPRHPEARA